MAWPTSREEPSQERGALAGRASHELPPRTTLPDLRARPVTEIPGIGPRIEAALEDLGVTSLADLVSHYPSRHEDLSNVKNISDLMLGEKATVVARVVNTKRVGRPGGRAQGVSAQLYDGTGYMPATVGGRGWLLNHLLPDA